jgi:hypothetical protein
VVKYDKAFINWQVIIESVLYKSRSSSVKMMGKCTEIIPDIILCFFQLTGGTDGSAP